MNVSQGESGVKANDPVQGLSEDDMISRSSNASSEGAAPKKMAAASLHSSHHSGGAASDCSSDTVSSTSLKMLWESCAGDSSDADRPYRQESKPKRPLTCYNIFFQCERKRILAKMSKEITDGSRPKICFEDLGKQISTRWKKTTPDQKKKYRSLAALDRQRYERQMEEWRTYMGSIIDEMVESTDERKVESAPSQNPPVGVASSENKTEMDLPPLPEEVHFTQDDAALAVQRALNYHQALSSHYSALRPGAPSCIPPQSLVDFEEEMKARPFAALPMGSSIASETTKPYAATSPGRSFQMRGPSHARQQQEGVALQLNSPTIGPSTVCNSLRDLAPRVDRPWGSNGMSRNGSTNKSGGIGGVTGMGAGGSQQQVHNNAPPNNSEPPEAMARLAAKLGTDGVDVVIRAFGRESDR